MRHAILCTRNGCRFDELSVEQHGPNKRRGIELRGDDATVVDSEFTTTHTPIVVHGADDVTIENCYADSVDDVSSLTIISDSGSVSLANNEFPDGVRETLGNAAARVALYWVVRLVLDFPETHG